MNIVDILIGRATGGGSGGGSELPALSNPAAASDIVSGKEVLNASGKKMIGSMTDHGAVSERITRSSPSYTIPEGYHPGTGKVYMEVEEANITPSAEAQTVTPSTGKVFGKVNVAGDSALVPENIKSGVEVFGVTGTLETEGGSGGEDFSIIDGSYLFYADARWDSHEQLLAKCQKITNAAYMFCGVKSDNPLDLSGLDVSETTQMNNMFHNSRLTEINMSGWHAPKLKSTANMFEGMKAINEIDVSWLKGESLTNMTGMFKQNAFKTVKGLGDIDTSNVTSIYEMFSDCIYVESLAGIEKWNTSKVTNFNNAFKSVSSVTGVIDLSGWDTGQSSSMINMFYGARKLEGIIGFSATRQAGMTIGFPYGSSSSPTALKRLVFRTDLGEGVYSIRSSIDIRYCSFDRAGMVEMFNSLPDVSALGLSSSYTKISITGNPCVTGTLADGTACDILSDTDKSLATDKGWQLVI